MRARNLPEIAIALALLLGAAGIAGKAAPAMPARGSGAAVLDPAIARRVETHSFSDRGPYVAGRYAAIGCLGEIWLLELHRNGEAADLLPGADGYLLDGVTHRRYPAFRMFREHMAAFAGLRAGPPRVFAYREAGRCGLAERVQAG
ncbi:MAG: hypothetical protein ACMVY4_10705 [Minwuia sp.]|uniref:hypothetical protein n=1 Tax=Minwuia sp. TaxID=2493630 RepID=UPI003A84AF26